MEYAVRSCFTAHGFSYYLEFTRKKVYRTSEESCVTPRSTLIRKCCISQNRVNTDFCAVIRLVLQGKTL